MMQNNRYSNLLILVLVYSIVSFLGCESNHISEIVLKNNIDTVSYSLGYQNGKYLQENGMGNIEPDIFLSGLKATLNNNSPKLSEPMMRQALQAYSMKTRARLQRRRNKATKMNEQKGQKFLGKNKKKPDIKTTKSGLQYKILERGSGSSPDGTDKVLVNYKEMLINGKVLYNSFKSSKPAVLSLNRIIKGFREGLKLMKKGAKFKLFIPSNLAFGKQPPSGSIIQPNQTLIIIVKLLEVNPNSDSLSMKS